jgi:L-seryl-tRNA(Ser) seleniumtransferase
VWKEWESRCRRIVDALKEFPDVRTEVTVPKIANAVPHLRVRWDSTKRKLSSAQMIQKLRDGTPSIEVGPGSRNPITVGVWMMEPGDDAIVAERLRAIFAGA